MVFKQPAWNAWNYWSWTNRPIFAVAAINSYDFFQRLAVIWRPGGVERQPSLEKQPALDQTSSSSAWIDSTRNYGPVVHPIWCIKKWLSSSHPHVPYPFRPQRRSVWRHLRSAAQLWGLHAVRLSHGRSCSWRHGRTALSRSSDTSSITRALESWNHSVVKVLIIIWIIWYDILFLSPHYPNAAYSQSRDTKMNRSKIKRRILMVPNGRGRDYSTINV